MEEKKKILLVCPPGTRRDCIRNCLKETGIKDEIAEVNDVSTALANLMCYGSAAVIFSDHNGVINALDFLKQLKAFEKGRFAGIPFIIIAKTGALDDVFEAGKLGVRGFILFDPSDTKTIKSKVLKKLKDLLTGWLI